MNPTDTITQRLYREGVIERPADLLVAIALLAGAVTALLLAASPALAVAIVAAHAGIPAGQAIMVGVGTYVALALHWRLGGGR